jgi:hypothetical protein
MHECVAWHHTAVYYRRSCMHQIIAEISILRFSALARGHEREAPVRLSAQAGECRGGRHHPPLLGSAARTSLPAATQNVRFDLRDVRAAQARGGVITALHQM